MRKKEIMAILSLILVSGGFVVRDIHNTLEAAVWNMPVIFGPNNKKFQEAQGLLKSGGGLLWK